MIAKISNVSSFSAVLNYIVNKKETLVFDEEIIENPASSRIGGSIITDTVSNMTKEFKLVPNKLKHPAKHLSISLPIGETLSADKWYALAKDVVAAAGYGDNQWICYRHSDQKHDHVHIVLNRKNFKCKTISDSNEKYKFMEIMRQMETKYNLTPFVEDNTKVKESTLEAKLSKRGVVTDKKELHSKIKTAISKSGNWLDFPNQLKLQGVEWSPRLNDEGAETGARYNFKGKTYAGSKVGYSLQNIEKIFFEKGKEQEHKLKPVKEKKKINKNEYAQLVSKNGNTKHLRQVLVKVGFTPKGLQYVKDLFQAFKAVKIENDDIRIDISNAFKEYSKGYDEYMKSRAITPAVEVKKESPLSVNTPPPPTKVVATNAKNTSDLDSLYKDLRELFNKPSHTPREVRVTIEKYDKDVIENIDPNMFVGRERSQVIKSKDKLLGNKDRGMSM
jgi:hypothetical protein